MDYLEKDDFIGADMARKFLQMGYTRARRYANHKSGRKYQLLPNSTSQKEILPYDIDPVKAESAAIFKTKWIEAKTNTTYLQLLARHKQMYENYSQIKVSEH